MDLEEIDFWHQLPDSVLLVIFSYLQPLEILRCSQICKTWQRVACDELLWKEIFCRFWKIKPTVPLAAGKQSWLGEFKRLYYHSPAVESEVLQKHADQVLHVSFSNNGEMFATSSKDGFIKVWNATSPVTLRYSRDMKEFTWKYTQFSQFNESDALLLVSGVHFGSHSTSGEVAVFSIQDEFELQCRVMNKPYDVFGTWYNDTHLLSGNLHWIGDLNSCSALWLNKAFQDIYSEHESVVMRIFKFLNKNASSIRTIMVAPCPQSNTEISLNSDFELRLVDEVQRSSKEQGESSSIGNQMKSSLEGQKLGRNEMRNNQINAPIEYDQQFWLAQNDGGEGCAAFDEDSNESDDEGVPDAMFEFHHPDVDYHEVHYETAHQSASDTFLLDDQQFALAKSDSMHVMIQNNAPAQSSTLKPNNADITTGASSHHASWDMQDKYLIFTMGILTYTPHVIGIKKISYVDAAQKMGLRLSGNVESLPPVEENRQLLDRDADEYDTVDYEIELNGHIIGMCLSPDHRYLYVNSRAWPKNYIISDPLMPPPIAQEIDIHVIDLVTMKKVGSMHQAHKAFTPNDGCFFIFLDVCNEYVASGAEDKHGYIWDRHYGICLNKFPHTDVVNSVVFNPKDSEMLVSVSDDSAIKVWRSRNRVQEVQSQNSK